MQQSHYISAISLFLLMLFSTHSFAYPNVNIYNDTLYNIHGKVEYLGCPSDNFTIKPGITTSDGLQPMRWQASSRGAFQWCLVTKITAKIIGDLPEETKIDSALIGGTKDVTAYKSSGTGYAEFHIRAFGDRYRIFSVNEYKAATKSKRDMSPGFHLRNHTQWPINYSLDQVGCLYHGIIPAGAGEITYKDGNPYLTKPTTRTIDTGAVWFTLNAHIQPDQKDAYDDWDCATPVIELTADLGLAVLTGGLGGTVTSAGWNTLKVAVKQGVKQGIKAGAQAVAKKLIWNAAERTFYGVVKTVVTRAATGQAFGAGVDLAISLAEDEEILVFNDEQAVEALEAMLEKTKVTLPGQYAGYAWPFRCDDMPTYDIYGGPIVKKDNDGNMLFEDQDFIVEKTNSCGNDFMAASPKSRVSYEEERGPGGEAYIDFADRIFLNLDCDMAGDGNHGGTKDALVFQFFDNDLLLAEYKKIGGACHDLDDQLAFIVPDKSNVTHMDIYNLGNDALNIDRLNVDRLRATCEKDRRGLAQGCLHEFDEDGVILSERAGSWGRWEGPVGKYGDKLDTTWTNRDEWIKRGMQHPDFPKTWGQDGGASYCIRKSSEVPDSLKDLVAGNCSSKRFDFDARQAWYTLNKPYIDRNVDIIPIETPYGSKSYNTSGKWLTGVRELKLCAGHAKASGYPYFIWYEVGDYGGAKCALLKVKDRWGKSSRAVEIYAYEVL
ncbi:MAG: hypothetical protein HON77_01870 [Gammaproteobacteria bacterium]|jgi:hypothetical protein|nr:hypothetical protein [Gammaproteobacteria bacterium]